MAEVEPTIVGASRADSLCDAVGKQSFEACPFYLGEVHAPRMIHAVFPRALAIAVLRNPRERTISAFNDYVRHGRVSRGNASAAGMESLVSAKVALLRSGQRTAEDFDMRMLTSGIYIYGLHAWGRDWPDAQLLVLRSEDMFAATAETMGRVQRFLQFSTPFPAAALKHARNQNRERSRSRPSRLLNSTLDAFFAPYNEELYAWAAMRRLPFARWDNATQE